MNFDDLIDLVLQIDPYAKQDSQGYAIDMYDAISDLGEILTIEEEETEWSSVDDIRNVVQTKVVLSTKFSSLQDARRTAISAVQSCYYYNFGAHFVELDETSMTIRYVTAGNALIITGSVTVLGPHYEKLFQEYLDFLKGFR